MTEVVLAARPWKTNAELIAACAQLGHIKPSDVVLDATYGRGNFWSLWRPDVDIWRNDARPLPGVNYSHDFRSFPGDWADSFDVVVLDGPYKLNGTPTDASESDVDERYGVHEKAGWRERHALIRDGITECVRVLKPGGVLLVKCQDQVCGGRVRWQTREFADHAEAQGVRLVDELHKLGTPRPQPPATPCKACGGQGFYLVESVIETADVPVACDECGGEGGTPRVQRTARRNYSTMLVFRKGKRR